MKPQRFNIDDSDRIKYRVGDEVVITLQKNRRVLTGPTKELWERKEKEKNVKILPTVPWNYHPWDVATVIERYYTLNDMFRNYHLVVRCNTSGKVLRVKVG